MWDIGIDDEVIAWKNCHMNCLFTGFTEFTYGILVDLRGITLIQKIYLHTMKWMNLLDLREFVGFDSSEFTRIIGKWWANRPDSDSIMVTGQASDSLGARFYPFSTSQISR